MKKLLLIVAAITAVLSASAQNTDKLLSNIKKAEASTLNEKKASNPATWIKYGDAYVKAYDALIGDGMLWIGMSAQEAGLLSGGQTANSVEQSNINGNDYAIEHYDVRDLYYSMYGSLEAIIITKMITEEHLLVLARDAYFKGIELDPEKTKAKDFTKQLKSIRDKFINEGMSYYTLGNLAEAAKCFEAAIPCYDNPIVNAFDSVAVLYAAEAYKYAGNLDKAAIYYAECIENGYTLNGDIAATLGEVYIAQKNFDAAKECLSAAFQQYPANQAVLVTLINLYIESGDNPEKVLELIRSAQLNDPTNPSLYYVEGNVYKELGDFEKALASYNKSYEVDPGYVYAIYSVGLTYFDMAIAKQEEMDKLDIQDIKGYEALMVQFEDYLHKSIEPFEKAFAVAQEMDIKTVVASALKQVYFRFRDKGQNYADGYAKYDAFLSENGVE